MNNWTVDQVTDWLKTNGFEMYIKMFIDQDIDGTALMGLRDEDILKLLADETGKPPTLRIQRKFRTILEEYRSLVKLERKKQRRNSLTTVVHPINEIETYSKIYTIESTNNCSKFLKNEFICLNLSKYFLKRYNVKCHIPMINQYDTKKPLHIKLSGTKDNVKNVQKDLQICFTTIKTKIFNNEDTDKRIIKWSKHIYSDSALTILQKILFDKKKLTLWEKTSVLSGYYIVHYLGGQHRFSTTEESIIEILNREISYAKDLVISDLKNLSTKFNEFLREKKEQQQQYQTMAIIYCQYPSQIEMKISFFGLKNQVNLAKKQLKMLMNQHRMQTIRLNLDSKQREYLLDNCVHQLKTIELDYKDDHVKIQIRENLIHTPQYLINKIKGLIQSMIHQTKTFAFQYIKNAFILMEKDYSSLKCLARNYDCELDEIKTETKSELIILPKGKTTSASKYVLKESKEFYSSLSIPKILPVSNHTIDIHKSHDLTVDITVISTIADAHSEQLDPDHGNGYFESDSGKRILFIKWSLPRAQENSMQIKTSIRKFISAVFKQIDTVGIDAMKTITFSTTDWEKYDQRKQLVEGILYEIKSQLESEQFSKHSWKILFVFPEEQNDFFNEFSQVISALQIECGDYEQFFYPISTTSITLKTSGNTNISKCKNAIQNYLLTTIRLNHPFDADLWSQDMINAYYKYCLEIFVLPKFDHTIRILNLIGQISAVNQAKEKYELMSEIERRRILAHSDQYNILLSCSMDDQILSRLLAHRLIDEGYTVSINYSSDAQQSSNIRAKIDKTDLVIICFSSNYSKDYSCMNTMQSIKGTSKKFIPILFTRTLSNQGGDWLERIATEEWFYESFEQDIRFKLEEKLNLDYDKLIVELGRIFRHAEPNTIDEIYPIANEEEHLEQREKYTSEQIEEKERIYKQQLEEIFNKKKILDDELAELIQSLKIVLEDPKEEDDEEESDGSEEVVVPSSNFIEFLLSIQRWLEKATNGPVIKGNLPPFSVTGDYNDAIFPIPSKDKTPWWMATSNLDDFNHSTPELDLRSTIGSWCNYDDTHDYFQKFIDREIRFREIKQKERSVINKSFIDVDDSSTNFTSRYPHFKTTIRKGTTAWDITNNTEVLKEYERRKNKGKAKKAGRYPVGYDRVLDQSVKLISDLKEGYIDMNSDEIQGKIGQTLKSKEEIRRRDHIDDPNNETWKSKRLFRWRREFIQTKIRNTLEWKEFCAKQGIKH